MSPPRASQSTTRSTLTKTKILINAYDLLPPGRLSSIVWTLGVGLLHSGVVINDREYAFGGHDRRGLTGVYWTKPRTVPPGGTFRTEILHGFTYASEDEISEIIREASNEFLGPSYNLLTRNCNHFTSHLCMALTGQPAPAYLNRAASIGVALPCVVPAGWVEPPECDLDDEDEQARLTSNAGGNRRHSIGDEDAWGDGSSDEEAEEERRRGVVRDTSGRQLPAAERARVDRTVR
ncbi:PPPDE putative peptidase domain-containing protein [Morchella snyderi]|nr:PPPDE putative peptidase domain-containing protein [Morchella snyderi]